MEQRESELQKIKKEMIYTRLFQREEEMHYLPLDQEYAFFSAVRDGNRQEALRLMQPLTSGRLGRLSDDDVRNIRYHLIITIALTTRFCIEAGLTPARAYLLSDIYIRRADKCTKTAELEALHREVILEFTKEMEKQKKMPVMALPALRAFDYVEEHLHERIRLAQMADALGVSKTYLCALFKRETGKTIGGHITERRVDAAKDLLAYTEYSILEISNYLAFSSASHFGSVFRNETGMSPSEYRKTHYRKHF